MPSNPNPIAFKRAVKFESKLRLALFGPSGSGKTYTALSIAQNLVKKPRVALIDTERGSARKYADLFDFDVLEMQAFSPAAYVEAIRAAEGAGYNVVIVDSLSHAWMGKEGALEQVDSFAQRAHGNTFAAWRYVTPMHNNLVDAMIGCKAHLIATCRSKTEYVMEKDEKTGKTTPRKIGLAPVQRDGLEYEFDVAGEMTLDNDLIISKSRCSDVSGQVFRKPSSEFAGRLAKWLEGEPAPAQEDKPLMQPAPILTLPITGRHEAMQSPGTSVQNQPDDRSMFPVGFDDGSETVKLIPPFVAQETARETVNVRMAELFPTPDGKKSVKEPEKPKAIPKDAKFLISRVINVTEATG